MLPKPYCSSNYAQPPAPPAQTKFSNMTPVEFIEWLVKFGNCHGGWKIQRHAAEVLANLKAAQAAPADN